MTIKKLDTSGFTHVIALCLVVVGVGIAGAYFLVASHAATNGYTWSTPGASWSSCVTPAQNSYPADGYDGCFKTGTSSYSLRNTTSKYPLGSVVKKGFATVEITYGQQFSALPAGYSAYSLSLSTTDGQTQTMSTPLQLPAGPPGVQKTYKADVNLAYGAPGSLVVQWLNDSFSSTGDPNLRIDSIKLTQTLPIYCGGPLTDLDDSGQVESHDLSFYIIKCGFGTADWLPVYCGGPLIDLNEDRQVDGHDLSLYLAKCNFSPTGYGPAVRLSMSPANQSVASGANVTTSVVLNTQGNAINAVDSVVSYDATKFRLVSIVPGSSFNSAFPTNTSTPGKITFTAGTTTSVNSSSATVATLTFTALGGSSSSTINLANACPKNVYTYNNCSAAYPLTTGGINILTDIAGSTYTITSTTRPGGVAG